MTIKTPEILELEARKTAVIRLRIPRSEKEMGKVFGPAVGELVATLAAQKISHAESVFAHHFKITPDHFDFEIGFTTDAVVKPMGRVEPSQWPKMKVAHAVLSGAYEQLPGAWSEFDSWIKASGQHAAEDLWEYYSIGPHMSAHAEQWRTSLYRPLVSDIKW